MTTAAFDVGATGAAAVRNYSVHVAAGSPLNVTLAFTDAPAALGAGSVAVNNLDLQVIAPNGTVYSGNNFNTETTRVRPTTRRSPARCPTR